MNIICLRIFLWILRLSQETRRLWKTIGCFSASGSLGTKILIRFCTEKSAKHCLVSLSQRASDYQCQLVHIGFARFSQCLVHIWGGKMSHNVFCLNYWIWYEKIEVDNRTQESFRFNVGNFHTVFVFARTLEELWVDYKFFRFQIWDLQLQGKMSRNLNSAGLSRKTKCPKH